MQTQPRLNADGITIHSAEEFEGMRKSGALAAATLDMITPHVVPGVTTDALDKLIHDFMLDHNAVTATLGYRGYHKSFVTAFHQISV